MQSNQDRNFRMIRQQTDRLSEIIVSDVTKNPGVSLDSYYETLQERRYLDPAIRTALWDLISDGTIQMVSPGPTLQIAD